MAVPGAHVLKLKVSADGEADRYKELHVQMPLVDIPSMGRKSLSREPTVVDYIVQNAEDIDGPTLKAALEREHRKPLTSALAADILMDMHTGYDLELQPEAIEELKNSIAGWAELELHNWKQATAANFGAAMPDPLTSNGLTEQLRSLARRSLPRGDYTGKEHLWGDAQRFGLANNNSRRGLLEQRQELRKVTVRVKRGLYELGTLAKHPLVAEAMSRAQATHSDTNRAALQPCEYDMMLRQLDDGHLAVLRCFQLEKEAVQMWRKAHASVVRLLDSTKLALAKLHTRSGTKKDLVWPETRRWVTEENMAMTLGEYLNTQPQITELMKTNVKEVLADAQAEGLQAWLAYDVHTSDEEEEEEVTDLELEEDKTPARAVTLPWRAKDPEAVKHLCKEEPAPVKVKKEQAPKTQPQLQKLRDHIAQLRQEDADRKAAVKNKRMLKQEPHGQEVKQEQETSDRKADPDYERKPKAAKTQHTSRSDAEHSLVTQVKHMQKTNPAAKEAWAKYCETHTKGLKDPALHANDSLQYFIDQQWSHQQWSKAKSSNWKPYKDDWSKSKDRWAGSKHSWSKDSWSE